MDEGKEIAEECKRLREVLDSKQEWWIRGMALTSLAKLEGQAGITRLVGALSDPHLRTDALKGLSSLAARSNDPIVLDILAQEIRRENPKSISLLVETFLAVGGNAKTLTQEVVDRLKPDVAATVLWLRNEIGPRDAAVKLRPACGDTTASEKTLEKISLAVRHYFGEYEPGEERPAAGGVLAKSDEEEIEKARAIEEAQSAEEIDALTLDQEGEQDAPDTLDGSGLISDDVARVRMEELTESGRDLDEVGAESETPGREDTSEVLASHVPNYEIARSETVDEGNVEEASQETRQDPKVDEGGV